MTTTIAPPSTEAEERVFPFRSSISTHPAPMTASESPNAPTKASLDLLISNDGFSRVKFESLTITFAVAGDDWEADAPSILTPVWNKVSRPKLELPPGWTEDTGDQEPGQFTFKPADNEAGPNDALRLHLDGIHVSAIEGITDVVISIETPRGRPGYEDATHSIGKFPIGFELKNFRADDPIVENGRSTKLDWTVDGDRNVTYQLFVNGVEKHLEGGRIEPPFHTGPLHTTTVYELIAKHQVGNDWLPYSDSTVVQVHGGEITAANALIAGLRPALLKTLISYETQEVIGNGGEAAKYECKGPGDGLVVGELTITGGEGEQADLEVQLICQGFAPVVARASAGTCGGCTRQHIIMPIPGGEVCEVRIQAENSSNTTGRVKLYWVSLSGDNRAPSFEPFTANPTGAEQERDRRAF
ncbi:hypothetical protein HUT06_28820 [Actinomadura sp. NAK00032]|uniref:hypothetical protein n=1 Tax=Actinomadura sp. NAK00032 TaxID=2742128 RepID=UPI00159106C2|nr:hypothetical protein [Actinomadura sp. NAK00032]QKW37517.1 hypothetical protein HUT06_28820 [Actinomadura sp. NAK00032]